MVTASARASSKKLDPLSPAGRLCVGGGEIGDGRKREKAFGVAGELSDLGQSGADHGDRQLALDHLVQGFDEGLQLRLAEELDLVEEQDNPSFALDRGFSEGDEAVGEVLGQVDLIIEPFLAR